MSYTPRTIAFLCKLLHPLVPPNPVPIQKLHNEMFQSGQPAYANFAVTPTGSVLSNPTTTPNGVSSVTFQADGITFREELGSLTHETFASRMMRIVKPVTELMGLQIFTAQQVTIRSLINPRNYKDSRVFLKDAMFGFGKEMALFDREPRLYGVRMEFPADAESPGTFALRVESFNSDPRSIYLENMGTFGPIFVARGLEPIEGNVASTYDFLVDRALRFVGNFDVRQEA
jgi:hypothetical protein